MSLGTAFFTAYRESPLTPSEAAALAAGGCGCGESTDGFALTNPDAPTSDVTWSGVLCTEGELTGDGRMLEDNSMRWENLPIPIRYAPVDNGGHDGAQVVGRILTITRSENGNIHATGDFDTNSHIGREAARQVAAGLTDGVSVDLDSVSFEIRLAKDYMDKINADLAEDPPQLEPEEPGTDSEGRVVVAEMNADDEIMVTTDGRIRAATLVAIPAFISAKIALDNADTVPVENDGEDDTEEDASEENSMVAGAAPLEPPAAWFAAPAFDGPTPLTITEDGRVFGHLAVWGTCHTAFSGQCVQPPSSPSGYAYFRTGVVRTREGTDVAVGRITLDTMHAGRTLSPADTLAHYEHTGKGAADVTAGEDEFGIWVAGAVRPGLPPNKLRVLRSSPLSGDWRRIGGSLELVAALAVNSPGFPVPRAQGLVASGAMQSLVASGMLARETATEEQAPVSAIDADRIAAMVVDQMELRARRRSADQMANRIRRQRAAALAARVGVR